MSPAQGDPNVEDFLENVNDVSMLIEGLKAGTISPEYIDKRQDLKAKSSKAPAAPPAASQTCHAFNQTKKHAGKQEKQQDQQQQQQQQDTQEDAEEANEEAEARQARLMQKVEELKTSRALKLQARHRYEKYVQEKGDSAGSTGTDYAKWDLWCPEDEEDDLFNSLTPPDCKALEKDINDRHKRMIEQRQVAERYRVAGNTAFRSGQYSEALRCYQLGVDAERTNISLHANAAQAALKIGCFVQAIEHCDKALRIAEFLHNNAKLPVCTKVYVRRATAYRASDQLDKAEADLQVALTIEPDNKDVQHQLSKARHDLEEQRKQKEVCKALAGGSASAGKQDVNKTSSALAADVPGLRRTEQLVQVLLPPPSPSPQQPQQQQQQGGHHEQQNQHVLEQQSQQPDPQQQLQRRQDQQQQKAASHGLPSLPSRAKDRAHCKTASVQEQQQQQQQQQLAAATELLQLLQGSTSCCVYFRVCGGLRAATSMLAATVAAGQQEQGKQQGEEQPQQQQQQQQQQQLCVVMLELLNHAVENDGNLFCLAEEPGFIAAAWSHLCSPHLPVSTATAQLLYTITTHEDARKLLSKHLGRKETLLQLMTLLRSAPIQLQTPALALLSNCTLDASCKTALQQVLEEDQKGGHGCAPCLQQLAASTSPAVAERALNLIGNMCGSPQLRAALHSAPRLIPTVIEAVARSSTSNTNSAKSGGSQNGGPNSSQADGGAQLPLCVAASTALYNLAVDAPVQECVANSNRLAHLLGGLRHGDARVVARLTGVVARCSKHLSAATLLLELRAGPALCRLIERTLHVLSKADVPEAQQQQQLQQQQQQPQQMPEYVQALDAAVRALAALTSGNQVPQPVFEELLGAGLVKLLQCVLVVPREAASDSLLGNAALCISHLAARAALLPALCAATQPPTQGGGSAEPSGAPSLEEAQADLVAALLRVAATKGGGTASRNAGIALARMAQSPQMLLRLKELRGLEIIHATARP